MALRKATPLGAMEKQELHPILHKDPVSGGELYISELKNEDSGVTIRGRFAIPRYARLDPEQTRFLETFLRCRGMLSSMERELGISYPTVRSRLDSMLDALEIVPVRDEQRREKLAEKKKKVLEQLEKGEISAAEAKARLKGIKG
ncbi:MAG: DUF2089 domain-containing protein [Fimbriimonas ginsengisoli]|uniref:DUF2089 domain-containing protein n=1 Tax=Fimbriimonas ginsengisoli TaxID=1005039 RepID=A0A931M0Z2_FIMGI|nr:DUF2089 domain-containing protein [Fimbriimonas ginsengisoli]